MNIKLVIFGKHMFISDTEDAEERWNMSAEYLGGIDVTQNGSGLLVVH